MEFLADIGIVALLAAAVRVAAPLLIAALGEAVTERAGVLNIGIEGMMLLGAWGAFVATFMTGSPWIGLAGGVGIGLVAGAVLAYLVINRRANQIVAGIAINLFALGFTSFVFRAMFPHTLPAITPFQSTAVPLLSDIPIVGQMLFGHTAVVYLAFMAVPVFAYVMYKTHFGLLLRATGESPQAVRAAGADPISIRYGATLVGAACAGLAGAALSVGQLSQFSENLTAGRGFFALAIVLVGRWDPIRILIVTLLFALGDALQLRLQFGVNFPSQFLQMIPYIVAILLTTRLLGQSAGPRDLGKPYTAG